jgi:hypothetical protein
LTTEQLSINDLISPELHSIDLEYTRSDAEVLRIVDYERSSDCCAPEERGCRWYQYRSAKTYQ